MNIRKRSDSSTGKWPVPSALNTWETHEEQEAFQVSQDILHTVRSQANGLHLFSFALVFRSWTRHTISEVPVRTPYT